MSDIEHETAPLPKRPVTVRYKRRLIAKPKTRNQHFDEEGKETALTVELSDNDEDVPSNQLSNHQPPATAAATAAAATGTAAATTANDPPDNNNNEEEEEDVDWHLLTQYIGPATPVRNKPDSHTRGTLFQRELDKFKQCYKERIDTINRATSHREALQKAMEKGRTPQKLSINIKPLIMQKEDPEFKKNWEVAIKESEHKLIDTLIRHLTGVIIDTNRALRQDYK